MPADEIPIEKKPEDKVPFIVVCRPQSGATLAQLKEQLNRENVGHFLPTEETKAGVVRALEDKGFTVYPIEGSTVVSACGTIAQFEQAFKTKLTKHSPGPEKPRAHATYCSISEGAPPADTSVIPGAILITISRPPQMSSGFPPASAAFHFRHPGDIALATKASLVHRQRVPSSGDLATGSGVVVAMIDNGFINTHRFYKGNGYDLRAVVVPPDTSDPTEDISGHGTRHAAGIFSCAPDVTVYGIKVGGGVAKEAGLDYAALLFARVIVCSWGDDLANATEVPDDLIGVQLAVTKLFSQGRTLVFSSGNDGAVNFPAMMPEVIAVGGVAIDKNESVKAYSRGSSFISTIFPGRRVPDLCAVASRMATPTAPDDEDSPVVWDNADGMTSAAAPQVAGVIALMLQRNPSLTPDGIKNILCGSTRDVKKGTTSTDDRARSGPDEATGFGFIDALEAWKKA